MFLTALVGFLVFIIFALLLLLMRRDAEVDEATYESWNASASAIAESLQGENADAEPELMERLRRAHGATGVEVEGGNGLRTKVGLTAGTNIKRVSVPKGTSIVHSAFDAGPLKIRHQRTLWIAGIVLSATIMGTALLLLFLPRVVGPIEALIAEARRIGDQKEQPDTSFLINTFRTTIESLRQRESELEKMRDAERERASELELIATTLTRSLSSGFLALDQNGLVYDINVSGQRILNVQGRNEEVIGKHPRAAFGDTPFARRIEELFASRTAGLREEISEESMTIGLTTVPLLNSEERFLGQLVLFSDLTHVRSLERRLQEMQTLADLGEIAAGIAHEFRNSLSVIGGNLRLAKNSSSLDEARSRIENAEKETRQVNEAIERLLAFAGPLHLELTNTNVRGLIEGTLRQLGPMLEEIDVELHGELDIEADIVLLSRAFENIISNSIASIRQHEVRGTLTIHLDPDLRSITISDNGIGLRNEDVARLMLPFQSDRPDGFGLGLSLSKKIIAAHGGSLRLSGEPGKGARVEIHFLTSAETS